MVSKKTRNKPPEVRREAQERNNNGFSPTDVLIYLIDRYGNEDAPSLDTYKRWMRAGKKDGTWLDWKKSSNLPATMKPNRKAQVSGINDAVLHFSFST